MTHLHFEDLPLEALRKSTTFQKHENSFGICSNCQHETEVLFACCDAPVNCKGSTYDPETLWEKIENELLSQAIPDFDAFLKDHKIDSGDIK